MTNDRLDLAGLCLRADDADDWPKDWYLRFGFAHVGTWTHLGRSDPNSP